MAKTIKSIGVCGLGFVGGALKESFKDKFKVETYDVVESKRTVNSLRELCEKCKIIFVAVPTPIDENNQCDLSNIYGICEEINKYSDGHIVVIKSSTAPGTTARLQNQYRNINFVFNPEFLTERNAVQDFKNQKWVILGGPVQFTKEVKLAYNKVFTTIHVYETDTTTAEITKFIINCFLATKVSFFNEIYQLCDKLKVNYDEALNLALLDERVSPSHCNVPGWDGSFGFGGSCFPANINILMNVMKDNGVDPKVLKAVWEKNIEVRPERDWELLEGRCFIKHKCVLCSKSAGLLECGKHGDNVWYHKECYPLIKKK